MKDNMIKDNELLLEELAGVSAEEELKFRKSRKVIKKKRALIVLFIILGLVVVSALSVVAFIKLRPEPGYDDSAAFYFSSDILTEEGGEYKFYDTIDFNIRNYADELRISKEPIENFVITVKADGKDITPKADITMGEATMAPDVKSECAVSVSVPEKYSESIIDISVVSSPVNKELKGSFVLEPAWDSYIEDQKGNYCAELVISANKDVALELSWDGEKLIADNTNSYIKTAENGENKCIIELSSGMSITIPMFKADPSKNYANDTKVVTVEETDRDVAREDDLSDMDTAQQTEEVSE
ncbi:MAG: hypothetical protein IKT46_06330 [Clostridia bacterium]|nr:hypothetical protein [Clostridia bacterium]